MIWNGYVGVKRLITSLFYLLDVIGNKVFGSSPQTTLTIADAQIVTTGGDFHEPI